MLFRADSAIKKRKSEYLLCGQSVLIIVTSDVELTTLTAFDGRVLAQKLAAAPGLTRSVEESDLVSAFILIHVFVLFFFEEIVRRGFELDSWIAPW